MGHKLRSILIALHSDTPESASQELVVHWARRTGAEVTGLAVVDQTVARPTATPVGGGAFKEEEDEELLSKREGVARAAHESFSRRCKAAGVDCRVELQAGVPHELLASELGRHDVVVVENEPPEEYGVGESPAEVLEHLIKIAPRPLVATPEEYRPIEKILVAFDGSTPASRTLFALVGSGLLELGTVRLLTVDPESEASAQRRAETGIDYLRKHEVETEFHPIVSDRSVAEVVCEEAEREQNALLAVGTHARSALVEFFLGSTTREILDRAKVPVFIHH